MRRHQIFGLAIAMGLLSVTGSAAAQHAARVTVLTVDGVAVQGDKLTPGVIFECVDFEGIDAVLPDAMAKVKVAPIVCKHRVDPTSGRLLDALLKGSKVAITVSLLRPAAVGGAPETIYTIAIKSGRITALRNHSDSTGAHFESFEIAPAELTVTASKVTVNVSL